MADALALASRYPGPAVATLGTSGMGDGELAEWLATCRQGITIHADADEAGERKARALRRQIIREAGGQVAAVKPVRGKDAADAAASSFGAVLRARSAGALWRRTCSRRS